MNEETAVQRCDWLQYSRFWVFCWASQQYLGLTDANTLFVSSDREDH